MRTGTGNVGRLPKPANFEEMFIDGGWEHIETDTGNHKHTIRRWIAESDLEALRLGKPLLCERRRLRVAERTARPFRLKRPKATGRPPNRMLAIAYALGLMERPETRQGDRRSSGAPAISDKEGIRQVKGQGR